MSENVIQTSFSAGELSPSLFARVDFAKYHTGAARMRNFFVDYRSGASTRPGTEYIRPTQQGSGPVRLVRFQQSVSVTYVLEFGNHYLRFISNGGSIVEPPFSLLAIVPGGGTVINLHLHNYNVGDLIFISNAYSVPQINNRYFIVSAVDGDLLRIVNSLTNQEVNSLSWPPYGGSGLVQRVFTIGTPYSSSDLALLKFSQKGNQMNITHPSHPPYILTLFNALSWTLAPAQFGATIGPPTITSVVASSAGNAAYSFLVTSVDAEGQESNVSNQGPVNNAVDFRTDPGSIVIQWTAVAGAKAYNVYAASVSLSGPITSAAHGFIGTTTNTTFTDSNIGPDFSQVPPLPENPFTAVNPQVSAYFQQRLVYANGGGNLVDHFWMSKPGAYYNFDKSQPSQADDSVDGGLASLEVNEIKSMIPMPSGLVMLTTHGAWQISGGAGGVATQGGPITPSSITATSQAYIGANDVPPILVNYDILFIQQKGSIARDLTYNIYANIYTGNDISILSSHLFYGHQILEWAYAEEPFKTIWCVREDGISLSLTLIKEQDMYGWARHDTYGNFKSVCTVTEGHVDATYFVVDRPVPGSGFGFVRQIERLAERSFKYGAEDAWCVDAGTKTIEPAPNATLSGIAPDANGNILLLTDFPNLFVPGHVGHVIRYAGGVMTITEWINGQLIRAHINQPITNFIPNDPSGRPNIAFAGEWTIMVPFTQVFGLDHLEGQKVSVLADGGVVNDLEVVDGGITLPAPVTKVIVGYGFQAQLQTMYLDVGSEQNTIQGKRKKIAALTVRCKDSRGLKAGRTFDTLTPIKEQNRVTVMGQAVPLVTADERIVMDPLWDVPGQICLQVDDPLPSTVLGVIPEVVVGDSVK